MRHYPSRRFVLAVAFLAIALSADASGQPTEEAANRGYQVVAGKGPDGKAKLFNLNASGDLYLSDRVCASTAQSVVSVGVAAVTVPASSLQGRRSLVVCNSPLNVGSPKVKCLLGGTAPTMALLDPGQVITVDNCFPFSVASTDTLKCISDTAGTAVTTFECS